MQSVRLFSVLLASPGDLQREPTVVDEVVQDVNLILSKRGIMLFATSAIKHSYPSSSPKGPQDCVNTQIANDADIVVGVTWTRLGTPTRRFQSGTVEEIERHRRAGKPTLLYSCEAPVPPGKVDCIEYARVKTYLEQCKRNGLVRTYSTLEEFRNLLRANLLALIATDPYFSGGPPAPKPTTPDATGPAKTASSFTPKIEKQAAHWQVRLDRDAFSPKTFKAFEQWHKKDSRHSAAFQQQMRAWRRTNKLARMQPVDGTVDLDIVFAIDLPFGTVSVSIGTVERSNLNSKRRRQ